VLVDSDPLAFAAPHTWAVVATTTGAFQLQRKMPHAAASVASSRLPIATETEDQPPGEIRPVPAWNRFPIAPFWDFCLHIVAKSLLKSEPAAQQWNASAAGASGSSSTQLAPWETPLSDRRAWSLN